MESSATTPRCLKYEWRGRARRPESAVAGRPVRHRAPRSGKISGMAVWTVKGGRQGEREARLIEHGLLGGGWEALPSLANVMTREQLAASYEQAYPDVAVKTASNYVGQLWSLIHRMSEGELVVLPLKTTGTIAVGRIAGPYEFRTDLGADLTHVRRVEWERDDVPRDAFDQDLLYSFGAFLTFGQVRRDEAESRILKTLGVHADAGSVLPPRTNEDSAADVEDAPDVAALGKEQVRQLVTQRFAGHALTDLVAAVLEAQGFTGVNQSPPGADRGVDVLAGVGPLGMDAPRLAVQVKTGQAGVQEFRQLRGTMADFDADQGLLVAWAGFKGSVRQEARTSHFAVRLWDADDLLDEVFRHYDSLGSELRSRLPLTRVWAVAAGDLP
jgi:restriction system protein